VNSKALGGGGLDGLCRVVCLDSCLWPFFRGWGVVVKVWLSRVGWRGGVGGVARRRIGDEVVEGSGRGV